MATSHNPKGGAKRTAGIVSHVKERFGFIDLLNKNLPISKVFFDFSSFRGKGDDLSKIYPLGTKVTLTFVESGGDHKVKHRAVNLEKAQNSGPQTHHGKQHRNDKDFVKHQAGRPSTNKGPNRQRSREGGANYRPPNSGSVPGSGYPHEPGACYPHYPPPQPDNPSTVDKIMGNALQFLNLADQMAERFISARASTMEQNLAETKVQESGGDKKKTEKHNKQQKKSVPHGGGQRKKAFGDSNEGKPMKAPMQCSEDSSASSSHVRVVQESPAIQVAQGQTQGGNDQKKKKSRPKKKGNLFSNPEANSFLQLLADNIGVELRNKLTSVGLKSLNELVLLRLTVGKQPTIRIFSNNDTSNHVLEGVKNIEGEDLERLLRKSNVVKMSTAQHYGVKGTLHSVRTVEQNGKVTGATLFCQLHEKCDEHVPETIEGKGFTAFVSDGSVCPAKYIYNYIREKTAEQAKTKDVLVLDVGGQLSGCDDEPHPSLGNVTRICCSSSSELPAKITESIDHMHECAVAINVDEKNTLQALQKMTIKGTQVIIEISPDLKSDISSVFGH